ncbi:MAG TPA: response regulator, partial [Bacteroidia bacterium]|nr:response regulator [Bacteroidia bacterium]
NRSFNIHSFATGEACMEKFKEIKPEIVVLDYHLNSNNPDAADGIKMLGLIKHENKETNVIILTGDDSLDIALKSFHHGAYDYVVKSETKFRKINYSLFNLFTMMEAKKETRKYKYMVVVLFACVSFLIGGLLAVQIFGPSIFK